MLTTVKHIKKKDLVQVMVGREKGKTGKVLRVLHKKHKVTIEKLNLVKRHSKPTGKAPGGIVEKEAPIWASSVLLYCEKCSKGVRTHTKVLDKGKKVRTCAKCEAQLDK